MEKVRVTIECEVDFFDGVAARWVATHTQSEMVDWVAASIAHGQFNGRILTVRWEL
jgi:hypothetical protein